MGRPAGSKNKTTVSQAVEEAVDELKKDIPQIVEDAVKEAIEEVKEESKQEQMVEYHPQPEPVVSEPPKKVEVEDELVTTETKGGYNVVLPDGKILVDKTLFYKMFKTCVQGYGNNLNKHAGVAKFGACLGATTPAECKIKWDECQKYLSEVKNG